MYTEHFNMVRKLTVKIVHQKELIAIEMLGLYPSSIACVCFHIVHLIYTSQHELLINEENAFVYACEGPVLKCSHLEEAKHIVVPMDQGVIVEQEVYI